MSITTMTFNGMDLGELLDITDIKRDIGNNRTINTNSAPSLGVNYQSTKIGAKEITVEFTVWDSKRMEVRRKLAGIFNVSEPQKLIFSDEPDKYYLATVSGDIALVENGNFSSAGSVTFLVPDGVAHSTTYKEISDQTEYVDKVVLEINNKGTAPAHPIITVQHTSENGWIGIVNSLGTFEMGSKVEEDSAKFDRSEELLKFYGKSGELVVNAPASAIKNAAILNDSTMPLTQNLVITNVWGRNHIGLQ